MATVDVTEGVDYVLDVRDEAAVRDAFADVVARHGRLDSVVHCAGVAGGGPVHLVDADEWDRVVDVNLKGTFLVDKHALGPHARAGQRLHRQHRQHRGRSRGPRAAAPTTRPRAAWSC